MAYNVLFQYRQVANSDGSFPAWVCASYPYVVDHPELRWEHRFPAVAATIAHERPDVLGLSEMRGGIAVPVDGREPEPSQDPAHGPALIRDLTRWMRDEAPVSYRWLSVLDVPRDELELDPDKHARWRAEACARGAARDHCDRYDPRDDHDSTKSFLAYRSERFRPAEVGAFELTTSSLAERRFAPWARLVETESGLSWIVVVVHLDPMSGAHRIASARRIRSFVAAHHPVPVVVLGDFNASMDVSSECACSCGTRAQCVCPDAMIDACSGESVYRMLTTAAVPRPLVDTFAVLHPGSDPSSVTAFRVASGGSWRSSEPCWPRALSGEGREHLPEITIEDAGVRVDYVFATPDIELLDAAIAAPVTRRVEIDGVSRVVHPSDHLPVTARVRVGSARATD